MYCKKCGVQIEDDAKFCKNCGTQLGIQSDYIYNNLSSNLRDTRKKHIVKNIILYFLIFLIILVAIGMMANIIIHDKAKTKVNISSQVDNIVCNIGETQIFDDLEITLNECRYSNYCGDLQGLGEANTGNVWCVIYLNMKNTTNKIKKLKGVFSSEYNFNLKYNNDYSYNETFFKYKEFLSDYDDIRPLETLTNVCVSFEVPSEVRDNTELPLFIEFSFNSTDDTSKIAWNLR